MMDHLTIQIKRRCMTLLEVLIALSLTAILLSLLMVFYRDQDLINQKLDQLEREAFQMMYIENRLSMIIPKIIAPNDTKKDFYFFVSNESNSTLKPNIPSLYFTYDNGNELKKVFSNHVLGRLYLDKEDRLGLATMPSPQRWEHPVPLEYEVLMTGVADLQFEFYVPPDKDRKVFLQNGKKLSEIIPKNHWHQVWKYDYKQLPAILRIKIRLNDGKEMQFAFPLPNTDLGIMYDK